MMCRILLALVVALTIAAPAQAQNGQLTNAQLSPIVTAHGCTQLADAAAAAYNTMALYVGKDLPVSGCDSAYRTLERQQWWRSYWCAQFACGNAAVPGTSNHGLGIAVDVPQWVRLAIDKFGPKFGWCKLQIGACGPSDAAHEWWHIRWTAGIWPRRPDPGTSPHRPFLTRGSGGPGQAKHVRRVQRRLRAHGRTRVRVDGQFGRRTCVTTKRFKRARRMARNCEVGPRTWRALNARPRRPVN